MIDEEIPTVNGADLTVCLNFARAVASIAIKMPPDLPKLCQMACFESGAAPPYQSGQTEQIYDAFRDERRRLAESKVIDVSYEIWESCGEEQA